MQDIEEQVTTAPSGRRFWRSSPQTQESEPAREPSPEEIVHLPESAPLEKKREKKSKPEETKPPRVKKQSIIRI